MAAPFYGFESWSDWKRKSQLNTCFNILVSWLQMLCDVVLLHQRVPWLQWQPLKLWARISLLSFNCFTQMFCHNKKHKYSCSCYSGLHINLPTTGMKMDRPWALYFLQVPHTVTQGIISESRKRGTLSPPTSIKSSRNSLFTLVRSSQLH